MQKSNLIFGYRFKNINNILITGGLGFIGSALIRYLLENTSIRIFNLDKITYASEKLSINLTLKNKNIQTQSRYFFIKGDIAESENVKEAINLAQPDLIIHLAAESHVDKSISHPEIFINSNIIGTYNLLRYSLDYYEKLNSK